MAALWGSPVITPDEEQLAVLASDARFNAIDGNAGAAKTTTLAMKLCDALRQGLSPEDILVLTYSPAAVLAFQQRLRWLGVERELVLRIPIVTFDTLCHARLQVLEGQSDFLEHPKRATFETVRLAIQEARLRAARRGHGAEFEIPGEGTLLIPALLHAFRHLKGTMAVKMLGNEFILTPESAREAGLDYTSVAVLQAYEGLRCGFSGEQSLLADSLAPRFRLPDDPIWDMARALTADDPIYDFDSHPLRLGVRLALVDEGHDLNRAMFIVLQHLIEANPVEQFFVVGDLDQVVHSDGGADAKFMGREFDLGIGPLRRLKLSTCRRFGGSLAVPLGQHSDKRYAFEVDRNTQVNVLRAPSTGAVATLIEGAFNASTPSTGRRPQSLAVLVRHPGWSVELENELARRGFIIQTNGFLPFLKRPEVMFIRTLVAWVTDALDTLAQSDLLAIQDAFAEFTGCRDGEGTRDARFRGLAEFRSYFLGAPEEFGARKADSNTVLSSVDAYTRDQLCHFIALFASGIEPPALPTLVHEVAFVHMFKRAFVHDEQVEEAMAALKSFTCTAASFETFGGWLQQMANLEFASKRGPQAEKRLIRLYTIPAAKGLEFDHVLMPDVETTLFDGDAKEERNLFYVGASRARNALTMTFRDRPSSFLAPFGRESDWAEVHLPVE